MQDDKVNFKKSEIKGFKKLSEDEVRIVYQSLVDSRKLAYILMNSEGNKPLNLKV